ncbi:MAG: hypothetical protein M0C28_24105 [Candidatus Moduliflexus flocculans]|nr:hypothetical protein [Candidatus Moduliflexus flocculans]
MTGRYFRPSGPTASTTRPSNSWTIISATALAAARGPGPAGARRGRRSDDHGHGHDEDHDQVVGDGVERVGDLDPDEAEDRGDGRPEDAVEGLDDPEAVL